MIRCNSCGTANLDGSEYCDECGMKLELMPRPSPRNEPPAYQPPAGDSRDPGPNHKFGGSRTIEGVPPAPPSFTTSTSIPKQATPVKPASSSGRSEPARTLVLSSRGRPDGSGLAQGRSETTAAKLVLERGGRVGKEFPIAGGETNIGRWDADSGIFPDVDLDQDDPEAKVSRRHARIVVQNRQYFIEDLGSTNGTFVNRGRRLLPGHRQMLQSGDEIIVGKTFLKFHLVK